MTARGVVLATPSADGLSCLTVTASFIPSMVDEMFRRVELGSALAATLLGLIWLGYEAHAIQLLYASGAGFGSGAGPAPSLSVGTVMLYFAAAALLFGCVSMGAYLHAVRGHRAGLAALWILAVLAVIGLAIEMFMPGLFLPPTIELLYLEEQAGLLWLEVLAVAATMLTVIAAVAGAPPRLSLELPRVAAADPDGSPTPQSGAPSGSPIAAAAGRASTRGAASEHMKAASRSVGRGARQHRRGRRHEAAAAGEVTGQ